MYRNSRCTGVNIGWLGFGSWGTDGMSEGPNGFGMARLCF